MRASASVLNQLDSSLKSKREAHPTLFQSSETGAITLLSNNNEISPLEIATRNNHMNVVAYLKSLERVKDLGGKHPGKSK